MANSRQENRYGSQYRERDSQGRFRSEGRNSDRYDDSNYDGRYAYENDYDEEDGDDYDNDYDYQNRYGHYDEDDDYEYSRGGYDRSQGGRSYNHGNESHGRQGFASMSRDEVRRIAAMGGRASHGGQGGRSDYARGNYSSRGRYNQATPDRDENGRFVSSSHRNGGSSHNGSTRRNGGSSSRGNQSHGRQGFASMSHDEVVRIARLGGRASHGSNSSPSRRRSR